HARRKRYHERQGNDQILYTLAFKRDTPHFYPLMNDRPVTAQDYAGFLEGKQRETIFRSAGRRLANIDKHQLQANLCRLPCKSLSREKTPLPTRATEERA